MKIFCRELNKEFSSKEEMFVALKENVKRIKEIKCAAIKESDPIGFQMLPVKSAEGVEKAADDTEVKDGDTIYPVINTTNILDSHGDVHLDGIWDNSVKDQKGKVYYAVNHKIEIGSIVSYPDEVDMSVKSMPWTELGQNYAGNTQALIFAAKMTDASNKDARKILKAKKPMNNSVRMQYVDMDLCVDSNSKGLEQERMNFYTHLPKIANKEDAMAAGYFWAVKQAKIVKEGSMVLAGSNPATPILYTDPAAAGQKEHQSPSDDSVDKSSFYYI